jgi:hypothetical protein
LIKIVSLSLNAFNIMEPSSKEQELRKRQTGMKASVEN